MSVKTYFGVLPDSCKIFSKAFATTSPDLFFRGSANAYLLNPSMQNKMHDLRLLAGKFLYFVRIFRSRIHTSSILWKMNARRLKCFLDDRNKEYSGRSCISLFNASEAFLGLFRMKEDMLVRAPGFWISRYGFTSVCT